MLSDPPHSPHVLVSYATERGSTRGVAERIAARLAERGAHPDVRSVDEVDDVSHYDAVVLGSGVYNQRWIPPASAFVGRHGSDLASRPVWLFSVGSFGDTHRRIGRFMTREPRDIGALRQAIQPRGYRVFAGVIQRSQWPPPSRLFFRACGGRFGDNRDWGQIDAWAEQIAGELAARPGVPSGG